MFAMTCSGNIKIYTISQTLQTPVLVIHHPSEWSPRIDLVNLWNPLTVKSKMADSAQIRNWDIFYIFLDFSVSRFRSSNLTCFYDAIDCTWAVTFFLWFPMLIHSNYQVIGIF